MEIKSFIENFADQFEDMDPNVLTPETEFKELEGWNSLVALSVIAMIDEEYDVVVKGNEITGARTINDLFETVQSRVE